MNHLLNEKVLITTNAWFYGPDGKQYRAAWGTLKGIHEAGKTLGFIPNRSHANWFVEIGHMIIMGCQVLYVIKCPQKPDANRVMDWTHDSANGLMEYERPSVILILE